MHSPGLIFALHIVNFFSYFLLVYISENLINAKQFIFQFYIRNCVQLEDLKFMNVIQSFDIPSSNRGT